MEKNKDKKAALHAARLLLKGRRDLESIKLESALKFNLGRFLRNSEILALIPKNSSEELHKFLQKRPSRTASGVTPVALMIKPEGSCKYSCIYCPFTGKAAKSYTGEEPAALRARQYKFDSRAQVEGRIKHFQEIGHPVDKCEAILMGGTFLNMPPKYKSAFVKKMYEGFNGKSSKTLEAAKKLNEKAPSRVIGLTLETRPDVCGKKQIDEMLEYGATRVELGVQNPDDKIYKLIHRGHTVKDVEAATSLLKDSAFKVCYHLMPGLPGSSPKKDIEMLRKVFCDSRFKPDMLKIYPTLVLENTELHKLVKKGEYTPYSAEKAAEVISEFYRHIPKWVRVMRIQRDIPRNLIFAGVEKSNLRELVDSEICRKGIVSKEIRGREIWRSDFPADEAEELREDYSASGGEEVFLSYEWNGKLIGFTRMRIPNTPFRKEIGEGTALIRELHIYGSEAPIGSGKKEAQHRLFGSLLLKEAERIAKEEFGKKEMVIISGVGAREYYYKKGYSPKGPYVSKKLI